MDNGQGSKSPLSIEDALTWTVDRGQSVHCRFKSRLSPQGPRAWLGAWRVPSVAEPPITKIQIAACGAHPVIAGAMAPIASITPGPVHVSTVNTRPVT